MRKLDLSVCCVLGVVLCCVLVMPAVMAHEPLSGYEACPSAMSQTARFAPLPLFTQTQRNSEVTSWPAPGDYDFCAYLDTILCQLAPIANLLGEEALLEYANMLRCLDADINGMIYEEPQASVDVTISINSAGECTVYWDGNLLHSNVAIPGWSPDSTWYMGFGARTGGANDYHIVDNFSLAGPGMNYSESFESGPGLGTLYGNATVTSSQQLMLTDKADNQMGSWTFLPSAVPTEFTVTYSQYIGDGSGADGMCFFFGPGATSAFGETGPGDTTGLRVTFHTYGENDNTIPLVYNGTVLATVPVEEVRQTGEWLPISGNGMLDGQYELSLFAYVLNTPSHPLHDAANTALQTNFIFFKNLIQEALFSEGFLGIAPSLAPYLIGSLSIALAGYAALGDPLTYSALDEVLGLLEGIGLTPPPGGVVSVTGSIADVGPHEDFDGDGFTNFEEYRHIFEHVGLNVNTFTNYVMNPPSLLVGGAKYYQVGTKITLTPMIVLGGLLETAAWEKEGVPLGNDLSLVIPEASYSDAGVYDLEVTHRMGDAKTTGQLVASGTVSVGDDPIPVAGLAGMAALSGALALIAGRYMRRRK
ncbi:MAG TPA: hypothetical protein ENN29_00170 [Candidatus Hydrogenedentes bacterium]|nr:hypothetical protein [Candidatus Hydrogenedentota bacterium]